MCANITLAGGTTLFKGLGDRLLRDTAAQYSRHCGGGDVKVRARELLAALQLTRNALF